MTNKTHLEALELRLSHERVRLANEKSEYGRALRKVWVAGIEKEIAQEMKFLGLTEENVNMTDDELLQELLK